MLQSTSGSPLFFPLLFFILHQKYLKRLWAVKVNLTGGLISPKIIAVHKSDYCTDSYLKMSLKSLELLSSDNTCGYRSLLCFAGGRKRFQHIKNRTRVLVVVLDSEEKRHLWLKIFIDMYIYILAISILHLCMLIIYLFMAIFSLHELLYTIHNLMCYIVLIHTGNFFVNACLQPYTEIFLQSCIFNFMSICVQKRYDDRFVLYIWIIYYNKSYIASFYMPERISSILCYTPWYLSIRLSVHLSVRPSVSNLVSGA